MDMSMSDEMVTEFLNRVHLSSMEEVEVDLSKFRQMTKLYREIMESLNELEGVDSIPELLEKVNKERDAVSSERLGWQKMREELEELKGAMKLKDDERLIDKWKSISDECQALTAQIEDMRGKEAVLARSKVVRDLGQVCPMQAGPPTIPAEGSERGRIMHGRSGEQVGDYHSRMHSDTGDRVNQSACYSNYQNQYNVGSGVSYGITRIGGGNGLGLRSDNLGRAASTLWAGPPNVGRGASTGWAGLPNVGRAAHATGANAVPINNAVMGKSLGWLANTLPEMTKYSGKKEDWDDFETGFMIRYGGMDTQVAMSLLKENLEGEAKDALRVVPIEEKAKGVANVLSWLRSRLSNETPFEEIELDTMLRHQKAEGKSVGMVCEELEEWTAKLNENDDISKEAARKRQLLILYEGNHVEHPRLLSLFMEGASYSKMKAALVELEYLRKTEMRSHGYINDTNIGLACYYCGEHGHGQEYHFTSNGEEGYCGAQSGL